MEIIQSVSAVFKFHYVSINSLTYVWIAPTFWIFKFHYVSINSYTPLTILLAIHFFKFHYVSINSHFLIVPSQAELTLNSIMFLLIPTAIRKAMQAIFTLNSIMFLLILDNKPFTTLFVCFKFHYVSINSNIWKKWRWLLITLNSIMFLLIHFCTPTLIYIGHL